MNRKLAAVAVLLPVVMLSAGCAPAAPRPVETVSEAAEQLPENCLTPTDGAVQALQDDVIATLGDVTFEGAGVIKSDSGDDFWYIALEFDEDGSSRTATWGTMQDPTTETDIAYVAVDDMAPLVSTYKQPADFAGTTSSLVGADDCIAR